MAIIYSLLSLLGAMIGGFLIVSMKLNTMHSIVVFLLCILVAVCVGVAIRWRKHVLPLECENDQLH